MVEVLALFACLLPLLLLSKKYKRRFISLPAFLLIMWLFVPLVLTQGYLFGLIVDYNRFLYFLVLPVIILFAMMIDHGSAYFAHLTDHVSNFDKPNAEDNQSCKQMGKANIPWFNS